RSDAIARSSATCWPMPARRSHSAIENHPCARGSPSASPRQNHGSARPADGGPDVRICTERAAGIPKEQTMRPSRLPRVPFLAALFTLAPAPLLTAQSFEVTTAARSGVAVMAPALAYRLFPDG